MLGASSLDEPALVISNAQRWGSAAEPAASCPPQHLPQTRCRTVAGLSLRINCCLCA